jgi:hypothetical protein
VFTTPTTKVEAELLRVGDLVLGPDGLVQIQKVEVTPEREFMYDLTVEDWHNFVLQNSGVVVSNSPDRNYHFRPPTHEETIDQYNKVFGYIWEDEELHEYLQRGLDMVIAAPPRTPFSNIDQMVQTRSEWKTLLLTGSMYWALQALQINWVEEEFSVAPETQVRVVLPDNTEVDLSIEELYFICCGLVMTPETKSKIKSAFLMGTLRIRSVSSSGEVTKSVVTEVLRHNSSEKGCVEVTLKDGRKVVVTTDHSLFSMSSGFPVEKPSGLLGEEEPIATVKGDTLTRELVQSIQKVPSRPVMYDLSVPGPNNFVLSNGILAHNSYSIGGVSLDIDKSSKYESLKQGAKDQFDSMLEKAKATVKIIRGLQQPRYGTGMRSAFGPYSARGMLTPSKFMGM